MSAQRPVTLIIGNSAIAERAAQRARDRGDNVVLALAGQPTVQQDCITLQLDDYDSYVDVFHKVLQQYTFLDNIILALNPPQTSASKDHIPGLDPSIIDGVVKPLMMAIKNVWYHWKRDPRSFKRDHRKLTILVPEGHDVESKTAQNAMLGFWRSVVVRTQIIGPSSDLVCSDLGDDRNSELTISALLAPPSSEPAVHIIKNGKHTTQSHLVGQCQSLPIQSLGGRLIPLMWLKETIEKYVIRLRKITHPPSTATSSAKINAQAVRIVPLLGVFGLAILAFRADRPVLACAFTLIASRMSVFAGSAIIAFAFSRILLGT